MRARQAEGVALHAAEGLVLTAGEDYARRAELLMNELEAARTEAQRASREAAEARTDLSGALIRVEQEEELVDRVKGENISLANKLGAAEEESSEVRTELGASRAETTALRAGRAKDNAMGKAKLGIKEDAIRESFEELAEARLECDELREETTRPEGGFVVL